MRSRRTDNRRPDIEALPPLVHVAGDAVTALNERGRAHVARATELVDAARAATGRSRSVAVRADQGPEGGARLLLGAPVVGGAQILILEVTWAVDQDRLHRLAPALTPREREVFALLVQGLGPGHVAERLGVTWHTARSHIRNVHRALRIEGRPEVAQLGQALLTPQVDGWTSVASGS